MQELHFIIVLLMSILRCNVTYCILNMYLDKTEVYHYHLGIKAELSYIRNGTINHNALNYVLTVPADLSVIHYIWETVDSDPVLYKRDIKVSDGEVLRSVTMNISADGAVPTSREVVAIEMLCNGLHDTDVEIDFNFNFSMDQNSNNVTQITLRRKKLCQRDLQKLVSDIDQQPVEVEGFDSSQLKVFYVVLCFGCSLFTLLIVCFLAYIVSNKKSSRQDPLHAEQQMRLRSAENENAPYILSALAINSGTSTSSNMSHNSTRRNKNYMQLDNKSLDLHDRISEITIQRKRIRLQKVELEGTFGRVFNGTYTKEDGSEEGVFVKTVMDFACPTQISLLLREGLTMYGLKHRNIMSVMGVSIEDHVEPFVIYLREGYSNLKKFLQKCKLCPEGIAHTLTTQEVVEIALQIIAGVQYMHKKKLLHRDLAARNCLLYAILLQCMRAHISSHRLNRRVLPNRKHSSNSSRTDNLAASLAGYSVTSVRHLKPVVRKNTRASNGFFKNVSPTEGTSLQSIDVVSNTSERSKMISRLSQASLYVPNELAVVTKKPFTVDSQMQLLANAVSKQTALRTVGHSRHLQPNLLGLSSSKLSTVNVEHDRSRRISPSNDAPALELARKKLRLPVSFSLLSTRDQLGSASKRQQNAITAELQRSWMTSKPTAKPTLEEEETMSEEVTEEAEEVEEPNESAPISMEDAEPEIAEEEDPAVALQGNGEDTIADKMNDEGSNGQPNEPADGDLEEHGDVDLDEPAELDLDEDEEVDSGTPAGRRSKHKRRWPFGWEPIEPDEMAADEEEDPDVKPDETPAERAWRRQNARLFKYIRPNMKEPEYLQGGAELSFEDTRATELRKEYLEKVKIRMDAEEAEFQNDASLQFIEPKMNRSYALRMKHRKKQPIATRIDGALNVKIADNALSRDLFPNDYHCLGDNENRPVKWLAIESLLYKTFSTASDVWSFGVTLWELTTLAQQPYVEVDPFEIEHYLKDGYRLSQPVNCPDELFAVMAYCWAMSPDERPTFSQLLTCLQDFRNQLNKYV